MSAGMVVLLGYVASALLLSVGAVVFCAVVRGSLVEVARGPERWLASGWLLIALALGLPWSWHALGAQGALATTVELWGGPRVDGAPVQVALRVASVASSPQLVEHGALGALAMFVVVGVLASFAVLWLRHRRLARQCRELPVLKRVGAVRVCASDAVHTPFATRAAGRAFIVVPSALVLDRARLCLVIAHEAQHHRRRDLHAALLLALLHALFFWNPLLGLWKRTLAELEDLACDRQVLRRWRVSSTEYARALLWAAESAVEGRLPTGARGMATGSFHSLKRRILMLEQKQSDRGCGRVWLAGGAACALLLATSWLTHTAVADHRVTHVEVATMAAAIERGSGFPVLADAEVVRRLNGLVAHPARERMRAALGRMRQLAPSLDGALRARGLPIELLSVALAESGFDNAVHSDAPAERRAAGLWQLVPSTGRQLGLEVSASLDQRLEPARATEAAATLLHDLFARYQDWPIAIAAYNAGARQVDALIDGAASTSEARARVLAGDAEHARYVRAVMAALILIENPTLLD